VPRGELIQKVLGWSQTLALWVNLGALLVGVAMYGLAREGGRGGHPWQGADDGGIAGLSVGVSRHEPGGGPAAVTSATAAQQWLYFSDEEIRDAIAVIATPVGGPGWPTRSCSTRRRQGGVGRLTLRVCVVRAGRGSGTAHPPSWLFQNR
jgi:hypothetical protein